jgi:hypothetical protein
MRQSIPAGRHPRVLGLALLAVLAGLVLAVATGSVSAAPVRSNTARPLCPPCDQPPNNDDKNKKKQHNSDGSSTSDTPSDTPATPETPATPQPAAPTLERPAGTNVKQQVDAAHAAAKGEAAANLAHEIPTMFFSCMLAIFIDSDIPASGEWAEFWQVHTLGDLCELMLQLIDDDFQVLKKDPPDGSFLEVALPSPLRFAAPRYRCVKPLTRAACARLNTAFIAYRAALANVVAADTGIVTSLNRLSVASTAGSEDGMFLQVAAAKAYSGELEASQSQLRTAGVAYSAALRAAHFDARIEAKSRQALIARLSTKLPASLVSKVIASGTVSNAAELKQRVRWALSRLPRGGSLTATLRSSPTGPVALYHTMTIYDAAAIVRALAAQGAVDDQTGEWLIEDLQDEFTAESPDERASALGQFESDVEGIGEPAASLLRTVGEALAG